MNYHQALSASPRVTSNLMTHRRLRMKEDKNAGPLNRS
jgi:hypothetical protein